MVSSEPPPRPLSILASVLGVTPLATASLNWLQPFCWRRRLTSAPQGPQSGWVSVMAETVRPTPVPLSSGSLYVVLWHSEGGDKYRCGVSCCLSMDRETDDQKVDRQRRAGRWLRQQRDGQRLSQRYMAERLGVTQQTYSEYERGQAAIPREFVPEIAAILKLEETDVWRCLEMALPRPLRTDQEMIDDWMRRVGGVKAAVRIIRAAQRRHAEELRSQDRPNPGRHGVKPPPVTHKGETGSGASQPEDPAI